VEVATNPNTRPSRLFDSVVGYIRRSGATIVRIYTMHEPLRVFTYIGSLLFIVGFGLALRIVYYYYQGQANEHIGGQVAAAILMILGFQVVLIGLVADAISGNRRLTEDALYRLRKMELEQIERNRDRGKD
jgi:hypothetical protein